MRPNTLLCCIVAIFFRRVVDGVNAPVCPSNEADCLTTTTTTTPSTCRLYLARSTLGGEKLTLFSGVSLDDQQRIGPKELLLSIVDANQNEYSPWHDIVWEPKSVMPEVILENKYLHELLVPGVGALSYCGGSRHANVAFSAQTTHDDASTSKNNVHRSKDPTAGSFSHLRHMEFTAKRGIQAGEELFLDCSDEDVEALLQDVKPQAMRRSLDWLKEYGTCLDTLDVRPSTLPGAGRGAFSRQQFAPGELILNSPMLHFDRSQLEIVQQEFKPKGQHTIPFARDHGIEYTDQVIGHQLLQNYCYGRSDSNVMLLPLAPAANFINHQPQETANAYIRWSKKWGDNEHLQGIPVMELFEAEPLGEEGTFVMEFVALKEIKPGDEIFIDYGKDWSDAWEKHVRDWQAGDEDYRSAADFNKLHSGPFRVRDEQERDPYPENLLVACNFVYNVEQDGDDVFQQWVRVSDACWRPCDLLARDDDELMYTAIVHSSKSVIEPEHCGNIPEGGVKVTDIPFDAITIVDKPYSTDNYLSGAFRHEIGVPETFYSQNWMAKDPNPTGDFIGSPLTPGMLAPIRWKETAEVVTPWAFRVGVPSSVRQVLLEYCQKTGILEIFRHVTSKGNGLLPGQQGFLTVDGERWYLQRPEEDWRSNLHWLSPGDSPAHEDYLQALSMAGFDQVLDGVGKYLNMKGLVAFHVTFIAVSRSTVGFKHHDILWTGAKTYNIIVPLLLANETGPELDLLEGPSYDDDYDEHYHEIGRYRYEYDVGSMMGDGAVHATSATDYRGSKEMRLAATIYVSDVNEENADNILAEYTQSYPPDDRELLLSWAGRHWRNDDPSVKLPKPDKDHILLRSSTTASD